MPSYKFPMATAAWQTLPAPTADALLQPVGGHIHISTDAVPHRDTAGVIPDLDTYPVRMGLIVKVSAVGSTPVSIRMWDEF